MPGLIAVAVGGIVGGAGAVAGDDPDNLALARAPSLPAYHLITLEETSHYGSKGRIPSANLDQRAQFTQSPCKNSGAVLTMDYDTTRPELDALRTEEKYGTELSQISATGLILLERGVSLTPEGLSRAEFKLSHAVFPRHSHH